MIHLDSFQAVLDEYNPVKHVRTYGFANESGWYALDVDLVSLDFALVTPADEIITGNLLTVIQNLENGNLPITLRNKLLRVYKKAINDRKSISFSSETSILAL